MKVRHLSLSTKMALLSLASVLCAVLVGVLVLALRVADLVEEEMGLRALAIARTLAQLEVVQKSVSLPQGAEAIQPIAEKTRLATAAEYVVVTDMEGTRYSHPVAERIGKHVTDADFSRALSGEEFVSRAAGVLGPSVRAFVPLKTDEGTRQVGVVMVGILTPTWTSLLRALQVEIYPAIGVGLMIGLLGAAFLAARVKRAMFSMEPEEIARLLEERTAIFQAMGEGIIAIDREGRITVMNAAARRIIGCTEEVVGKPIEEVLPDSHLRRVLSTGQPEWNQERVLQGTVVISNRVPVRAGEAIVGAVSTFREKSEVHRLAEELTGVKALVEALRVQNHEHQNKLHTIAGLIQLGRHKEALDYIYEVTEEHQKVVSLLTRQIGEPCIAGLLAGKYGRAKELGVQLEIDPATNLKALPVMLDRGALTVILGNLLENALEAVRDGPPEKRKVYFGIFDGPEGLTITVRDKGPGILAPQRELVFRPGYTTKGSERGLGLHLVHRSVATAGGTITITSNEEWPTVITVTVPRARPGQKSGGAAVHYHGTHYGAHH